MVTGTQGVGELVANKKETSGLGLGCNQCGFWWQQALEGGRRLSGSLGLGLLWVQGEAPTMLFSLPGQQEAAA